MFCLFVDKCQYQQTNAYSKVPIETCELCLKLTIKTSERRQWRRFGVFIGNIERFSIVFSGPPKALRWKALKQNWICSTLITQWASKNHKILKNSYDKVLQDL